MVEVDVIDYSCGNIVPIVDEFQFKVLMNLHQNDVNLMTDKTQVKYSLITAKKFWEGIKFQEDKKFQNLRNDAGRVERIDD